ncbi:MAG: hypothetical protein U0169_19970 [Polyangiaceae bacterium]
MNHVRGHAAALGIVTFLGIAACGGGTATGIVYEPASRVRIGGETSVRLRVDDTSGRRLFCQVYPVREDADPGDTIALFDRASTLALSPSQEVRDAAPLRIRSEWYAGAGATCDDDRSTPFARVVAVVSYAEGRSLPVRSTFDASCIGNLTCDPDGETCRAGRCVDARGETSSGSVDTPCFDVRSCPTLSRAIRLEGCTFRTPAAVDQGYVAVTFALDGGPAGVEGVAVLGPDEYERTGTDTFALTGSLCTFADRGTVTNVYFGFQCAAPANGARICPVATSVEPSPLASLVTGDAGAPNRPDGGSDSSGDATTNPGRDDGDAGDSGADVTADDGSGDGARDASDSGTSESGLGPADGGSGATGRIHCRTGLDCASTSASPLCCAEPVLPNQCTAEAACTQQRFSCDDTSDCGQGFVCCGTRDMTNGPIVAATCRPDSACAAPDTPMCSTDFRGCPSASACGDTGSPLPAALACFPRISASVACTPTVCSPFTGLCCLDVPDAPECTIGTCANLLRCDDAADCPSGNVCCRQGGGRTDGSSCKPMCIPGTEEELCSDENESCSGTSRCGPPDTSYVYAQRTCR